VLWSTNPSTFYDWILKNKQNKQIINLNCHVSSILILIPSFDNRHTINFIVYIRFDVYVQFQRKEREKYQGGSLAGTSIHRYGYYDTRTHPVNIRVSKIPVPTGNRYPFLISIFYPLRVLSANTREYGFFWHP